MEDQFSTNGEQQANTEQGSTDQGTRAYQNYQGSTEGQPYPNYQQPSYQGPFMEEPVSVGDWVLTMIIMMIPIVNIIMLFVWGFGDSTKKSKSNWCKASLIMALIGIVLSVIMIIAFGSLFATIAATSGVY